MDDKNYKVQWVYYATKGLIAAQGMFLAAVGLLSLFAAATCSTVTTVDTLLNILLHVGGIVAVLYIHTICFLEVSHHYIVRYFKTSVVVAAALASMYIFLVATCPYYAFLK